MVRWRSYMPRCPHCNETAGRYTYRSLGEREKRCDRCKRPVMIIYGEKDGKIVKRIEKRE